MPSTQAKRSEPSEGMPGVAAPAAEEPQKSPPPESAGSDAEKREALIRIAAYTFYERRGYVGGHELEDWLQAEMEVDRQLSGAEVARPKD